MRKIIFAAVCLICALLMCSCNKAVTKDILDADGNAVATGYYDGDKLIYEEKTDDSGAVVEKTEYDEAGRVSKVMTYRGSNVSSEDVYAYGENDGDYTLTSTKYNTKGIVSTKRVTTYENALPVKEVVGFSDNEADNTVSTYKYNEDGTVLLEIVSGGNKIREVLEDGNGGVLYDHEYSNLGTSTKTYYGEGKTIIKIESFNKDGKLVYVMKHEYDDEGKVKKSTTTDADGNLKDYSEYVYVGKKLKGIHKYNANGTIHSTIVYDENGKATIHKGQYVDVIANEGKS